MNITQSVSLIPAEVITLPKEVQHHSHEHHQLVIATCGHSEFNIEGLQSLIVPGQGCVVTAASNHVFNGFNKSEILTLNLGAEDSLDRHTSECFNRLFSHNHFFRLDAQFQTLLSLLVKEIRTFPADKLVAEACKNTIVTLLQRHMDTNVATNLLGRVRINMDIIDDYIHKQMSSKITVAQLAGCVFLGESQFHLLFKQQVGITPHQYILKLRFNYAKGLLKDSSLSLSAIANASGFANQSSFTHTFTKFQGNSPSKCRH